MAGALPLSADLLRAISRDGPIATGVAMAAVAAIVLLMLGLTREALVVMVSLLVGVLWMVGATLAWASRSTSRISSPSRSPSGSGWTTRSTWRSAIRRTGVASLVDVRWTGGAVVLCSMTTVIGYSSLLMAQNRALFLFGAIAVLGEVTCVSVAIVALPSLLQVLADRGRRQGRVEGVASDTGAEAKTT